MKSTPKSPTKSREKFFRVILILLPFIFIVLVELFFRIIGYGPNLDLFVTLDENPKYLKINPNVGTRYFPSLKIKPQTSYDVFLKEKPENGLRIFVLGGSTAYGYPYGRNGAFSSFLKDRLQDYLPQRHVEVVNTAMCAVGSYTVRDIGFEVMKYQPDAIFIYSGHNEFYGALGVGSSEFLSQTRGWVNFYLKLRRYKTFQFVRDLIVRLKRMEVDKSSAQQKRLMEHLAADQKIAYGSESYDLAKEIYLGNIRDLINQAEKKGIQVVLGELVSNVKDMAPFCTSYDSKGNENRILARLKKVENLLEVKLFDQALALIKEVEQNNPRLAQSHYLKARCLEGMNKINQARESYQLAKDFDCIRFRAPDDFNVILKDFAAEENVIFIPLKNIFENSSRYGIVGNELMTDHLHPNLTGYFLMGKSYFHFIQKNYPWEQDEQFGEVKPDSIYWHFSGVTSVDVAEADFRIEILTNSWPFTDSVITVDDLTYDRNDYIQQLSIAMFKGEKTWEEAHVTLGEYYIRQNKLDLALLEYNSLMKMTPYNVSPFLQAGKIQMHQRRFRSALNIFMKSLAVEKTILAYQGIGEAYLHLGEPHKGIPYLQAALKSDKKNPLTLILLAKSYYRTGDKENSKKYAHQLYRINPSFPGLKKLIADLKKD